jgi:hypothetical protein
VLTATRPDRKVGGPLGPLSGAGFSLDSQSGSGPCTSGYELCREDGPDAVTLGSISPASNVGTGLHFLGAVVRVVHAGANNAIGVEAGYPPRVTEVLHPLAGYRVTQQCTFTRDGQPNGQPSRRRSSMSGSVSRLSPQVVAGVASTSRTGSVPRSTSPRGTPGSGYVARTLPAPCHATVILGRTRVTPRD